MNKVAFPQWANETEKAVNEIYRVTSQIRSVKKKLSMNGIMCGDENFDIFFNNVCQTLNFWTGDTYVGCKKSKSIQKAFQAFFVALYDFLLFCQREDKSFLRPLKDFADDALYRGTIYRYLGHGSNGADADRKVEPEYNDIYVSWSKMPNNNYFQSKLHGTITLLTGVIAEPYYGIDLEAFEAARGNEAEVVFPTLAETISSIEYIE